MNRFSIIPAEPGWHRAIIGVPDLDEAAAVNALDPETTDLLEAFEPALTEPMRPVVAWVVTHDEGTVGLTPGESAADALDAVRRGLGDYVAHVSPDGCWITATEVFISQETFFAVLRREAEDKARRAAKAIKTAA